jgi:D-sedoheptulose 7-phosphate isomerase
MKEKVVKEIQESIEVLKLAADSLTDPIVNAAKMIIEAYKSGKKVLLAGNGGSAADSQHFAAELVGRYKKERKAMPAIALTTDTSALTAIGNDYGFDKIVLKAG